MLVVSNTTEQTLAPGQAMTFDAITWQSPKCGCNRNEFFRMGTSNVRVSPGVYDVEFHANVTGATAALPVQLAIALDGSPLPTTTAISTPSAANAVNNVSGGTIAGIELPTGGGQFTLVNNGVNPIIVSPNTTLKVVRRG